MGITSLLILSVFLAGFAVGVSRSPAGAQEGQPASTRKLFEPFWEAWDLVQQNYVDIEKIEPDKLMQGAIAGMVNAIGDRHTAYMDPELFRLLNSNLSGSFEGIGATVRKDEDTGGLVIVNTLVGSPARELLKRGDIILTVDGEDITRLAEMQIISKVRGPAGTSVTLGILREGSKKLQEITLLRARIVVETVTWRLYEGNIGYIKLNDFNDNATEEFTAALRKMDADNLNGLIFDLRDDPGGGLQTAIEIASQFIRRGVVVIQRGKPGTDDIVYRATGDGLATTVPLVVLINEGSASASELVSGALKDYNRAVIVGTRSFGKGSVQTWRQVSNGGGLRITIAHFFTPKNNVVDQVGVMPDVYVDWTQEQQETNPTYDPQLQEALWTLRGKL